MELWSFSLKRFMCLLVPLLIVFLTISTWPNTPRSTFTPEERQELLSLYYLQLSAGMAYRPISVMERDYNQFYIEGAYKPAIELTSRNTIKVWTGKDSWVDYEIIRDSRRPMYFLEKHREPEALEHHLQTKAPGSPVIQ